jgi:3-dehydroquinate synthase
MKPAALTYFFIQSIQITELLDLEPAQALEQLSREKSLYHFIQELAASDLHTQALSEEFAAADQVVALDSFRQLRSALSLNWGRFLTELAKLAQSIDADRAAQWLLLADRVIAHPQCNVQLRKTLLKGPCAKDYSDLESKYLREDAHVVYPTSPYRKCAGHVVSNADYSAIDGVITSTVTTSIRVVDHVLNPSNALLRELYLPLGRCIAFVDSNVDEHFGEAIQTYFKHHAIELHYKVHRAMEVDKDISKVETILGELKQLGAARNEPILIVGGGVLADIAGFAAALYHRNTPYVMLNTSIVSGIDAGPSPRTCSDGYGYKNLFGAYHAPILSITDRSFFKTLHPGWIRHGIAEIIKMGGVKDLALIELLEAAGPDLVKSAFGTVATEPGSEIDGLSKQILGLALKSYVESEYDNLYETHQCRPHAFGHTWSPGFEIASGMLHGHAVSVGMGFNGYLSYRMGWIKDSEFKRLLAVIQLFDLSLWHDILLDFDIVWSAQQKMIEKRGGNLSAPMPKGRLGQCGYLNELSRADMEAAILEYQVICQGYPRSGIGLEPLCTDVGLEDPGTIGHAR